MKGKRVDNTKNGMKPIIVLISILIIVIIIIAICISNNNDTNISNYNSNNNYSDTKTNTSSNTSTSTTTNTITHYCDATGCTNEGIYSIDGVSGKEYYCYEHYQQMEAWAEMFMGY